MRHMEAKHWYCQTHDRASAVITWASNGKLMPSYSADLQVRSRPGIALQTELQAPHLRKVWGRL